MTFPVALPHACTNNLFTLCSCFCYQ
jgi:hypothetical protein